MPEINMDLPARAFAAAWLNAWQATGGDDSAPVLYRTVMVEALADGVRLWATDRYVLLRSTVDVNGEEIDDDETGPTLIAMDPDQRAKALMAFILKDTKDGQSIDLDVTIGVSCAVSETGAATLAPELSRRTLVLDYKAERLALDLFEAEAPDWRLHGPGAKPEATERIALGEITLKPISALRSADGRHGPVEMSLSGEAGVIGIRCGVYPEVRGAIMPTRVGAEHEAAA